MTTCLLRHVQGTAPCGSLQRAASTRPRRAFRCSRSRYVRIPEREAQCGATGGPDDASPDPLSLDLPRTFGIAGLAGTVAVVLGRALGVDPFGNLHWSAFDFLIGVECALPLVLMHFTLFSNNWATSSGAELKVLNSEGALGVDPALSRSKRSARDLMFGALDAYCQERVIRRRLSKLIAWQSLLGWGLKTVPLEMLNTALFLTSLGNWIRDRLYEGGVDDVLFMADIDTAAVGKSMALVLLTMVGLYRLFSKASQEGTSSNRRSLDIVEILSHRAGIKVDKDLVQQVVRESEARSKLSSIVRTLISYSRQFASGVAFIATGNLTSSLVTAALSSGVETLLTDRRISEEDERMMTVMRPLPRFSKQILATIGSDPYRRLKSDFLRKVREAEGETPDEEGEELGVELSLSSFLFVFRSCVNDLDNALASDKLDASEVDLAESEKRDLEALLERAAKLTDASEASKPVELNFNRDIKDRYKGKK